MAAPGYSITQVKLYKDGVKKKETVSVADADGRLYVFPALQDPVRESRGMLAGEPDLVRILLEERAVERGRE
jgi:hypothetical protein